MPSQVYSGAATGAEAGYKVGGGWGALVGAAVGSIGGIFGDRAASSRRQANASEQKIADIRETEERRQLIRQSFIARGQALSAAASQESGGMQSSGTQGALSSISTQTIHNIKAFDAQVAQRVMENYYLKRASKDQGRSDIISGIIAGINGGGGGGMGGMGGGGGGGGSSKSSSSSGSMPEGGYSSGMNYGEYGA